MRPPSVDRLARELADTGLPHPLLVEAARAAIVAGEPESARSRAEAISLALLRPVINATGVLLHTNLGRAPFGPAHSARAGYWNLEFDLATGRRGSRHAHAAALLARAAGAEDALVVNNGAAAVLLVLAALAAGRGVVVSRGELVEIGGGFRVPEVLEQSGARLVEVGTTNRTRVVDYQRAAAQEPDIALLLKVHTSNYQIVGFTESASVEELATLGPSGPPERGSLGPSGPTERGSLGPSGPLERGSLGPSGPPERGSTALPVVVDVGSGLLDAATPWIEGPPPRWLGDEPAVRQTLAAGAALVTFSGDKLLGGPQAGIIAGAAELVERCRRHPLARAFRPGGMVLAALQEVALAYLRRDGMAIPFWRMASTPVEDLRRRAAALGQGEVVECASVPGGGSAPGATIASAGVAVSGDHSEALRAADPPVIARVLDGRTVLDLRTVDPADDPALAKALAALS